MKSTLSLISNAKTLSRVLMLATFAICAGAYAQAPAAPSDPAQRDDTDAPKIPDGWIGTWRPYSRGYQQFGDLRIGKETLSWSFCQSVRYRVFKQSGDAYYIEQTDASACDYDYVGTQYLVLVLTGKDLEVSICRERDEFDRPPTQKYCSWGVLNKLTHPTADTHRVVFSTADDSFTLSDIAG